MKTREDLVEVIGEAETGEEAIQLAGELASRYHPDGYLHATDGWIAGGQRDSRSFSHIAIVMLTIVRTGWSSL